MGQYQSTFLRPDGIRVIECPLPNCWTITQGGATGAHLHWIQVHSGDPKVLQKVPE